MSSGQSNGGMDDGQQATPSNAYTPGDNTSLQATLSSSSALGRATGSRGLTPSQSVGQGAKGSAGAASPSMRSFSDALADLDDMMAELATTVDGGTTTPAPGAATPNASSPVPVPPPRNMAQAATPTSSVAKSMSPVPDIVPVAASASLSPGAPSPLPAPSPQKPYSFQASGPPPPIMTGRASTQTSTRASVSTAATPEPALAPEAREFIPKAPSPLPLPSATPIEIPVSPATPLSPISLATTDRLETPAPMPPLKDNMAASTTLVASKQPDTPPDALPKIPPISFSPLPEWPSTMAPAPIPIAPIPDRMESSVGTNGMTLPAAAYVPQYSAPAVFAQQQNGQLSVPMGQVTSVAETPLSDSEYSQTPYTGQTGYSDQPQYNQQGQHYSFEAADQQLPEHEILPAPLPGTESMARSSARKNSLVARWNNATGSMNRPVVYVPTNLPPQKKERRGCCGLLPFRWSDVLPGYRSHVWARFLYFLLFSICFVVILCVPTALVYVNSTATRGQGGQIYPGAPGTSEFGAREGLLMSGSVLTLDDLVENNAMLIQFNFWPTGRYADPLPGIVVNTQPPPLAETINCAFGPGVPFQASTTAQYTFVAGAPPPLVTVPAPIFGAQDMFPFDAHTVTLAIRCWTQDFDTLRVTEVPIFVEMLALVQSWKFSVSLTKNAPFFRWTVTIDASRSSTTIFFSIFVMILMWCLAISMLYLFYYYAVRAPRGRMPSELLNVGPTIVFALPFVRDAVPGTPPVGVLSDYVAFFWAEAIVVVATVGTMAVWFLRHQAPFHANWRWDLEQKKELEGVPLENFSGHEEPGGAHEGAMFETPIGEAKDD